MPYTDLDRNRMKVEDFPHIDAERFTRQINNMYPAYVFFRKGKKELEIWTSCCGRHVEEAWIKKTMTPGDRELRQAKHNEHGNCPFCRWPVQYKETGRLGKRKNLEHYIPVVILSARDGDLYARAYWTMKDYQKGLEDRPTVYAPSVYRFSVREHAAQEYIDPQDECFLREQREKYRVKAAAISEPFTEGGWCMTQYVPYTVLNPEEIGRSDLRYCQYEAWKRAFDVKRENRTDLYFMRYLTIAAIYPDKTEMLMKSGLGKIVDDFVCMRRKHTLWFDWDATDFRSAFKGMSREQLREIAQTKMNLMDVDLWAKLRRSDVSLQDVRELCKTCYRAREIFQIAARRKIDAKKLVRYLKKQAERKKQSLSSTATTWIDYVETAEELGWALGVESVLLPPRLEERHNEAVEEREARRRRKQYETEMKRIGKLNELLEKNEKQMKARRRKYNIEADGYFIRIAENGEEIIREGETLGHCVGGYAERHLNGQTTILFLRRVGTPEASLYTIEMYGDTLQQIHGYKDDIDLPSDRKPQKTMAWLLDPWLEWIKAGSPRDKDGRAEIEIKTTETKEALSA